MKYMMFVCTDTEPDTDKADEPDIDVWVAENDARGRRLEGNVLGPRSAATTVRVRNGELLICDGPFAEIKEVIVGYDLIEVADLDEAIEVARTHPMARGGRIELRPSQPRLPTRTRASSPRSSASPATGPSPRNSVARGYRVRCSHQTTWCPPLRAP